MNSQESPRSRRVTRQRNGSEIPVGTGPDRCLLHIAELAGAEQRRERNGAVDEGERVNDNDAVNQIVVQDPDAFSSASGNTRYTSWKSERLLTREIQKRRARPDGSAKDRRNIGDLRQIGEPAKPKRSVKAGCSGLKTKIGAPFGDSLWGVAGRRGDTLADADAASSRSICGLRPHITDRRRMCVLAERRARR